jgi:hypothetical protein
MLGSGKSRRSLIVMVLTAFAAVFLAIPSTLRANDPPPRSGSVAGIVYTVRSDRTLVPVGGAHVEIMTRGFSASTRSNDSGGFNFPTLRPGLYQVNASKAGVGLGRARVEVVSGQTARVRIILQR